ncbi:Putative NAD(P)-dependent oxidoreductase EC-YbbO [hydrothermal vent metagenome]|uniref:NAD(P)-dependent oxidoreductase EC-YbbO n=1 Tax=hydrothermal vent metagenome TaxID=652676 RepID=A0A3B1BH83_9ZZZZ
MKTLAKRSILITGCSSGIGRCVARGLQARGYRVFATARKADDVARLQTEGLESLQLDLNDSESIHHAVVEVLERTNGELYALFNNGAYGQPGAVEDLSRASLRAQFETNLFGWHELTCLILPVMRKQGYGRIIQNSSVLGLVALKFRGAYNASKYALEGLSDTLRQELHGTNIHISLIEPGPIESRFRSNGIAHFKNNIDIEHSPFREQYQKTLARLNSKGPVAPFTLPPEAVLKKVIHALENPRPQPRYYVTFPTWLFGSLRRILTSRALDRLLRKI